MEAIRMTIIHNPGSNNTAIANNNPQADKEDQIQMLRAHISYFLRNMTANGASGDETIEAASNAIGQEIGIFGREWLISGEYDG